MNAAQIAKLVDRGVVLVREIDARQDELKRIEKALKAVALKGEHEELKDAAREGRRYLAHGTGIEVPVIFSADLLIASFAPESETHAKLQRLAGDKLGEFFALKPSYVKVIEDGKAFRLRADELLGDRAPSFITASLRIAANEEGRHPEEQSDRGVEGRARRSRAEDGKRGGGVSDTFIEIEVKVRDYGGAYIARAGRFQASCTSSETWAAQTAAAKAFNAEPRVQFEVQPKHVVIARHDVKASMMACRLYLGQPLESGVPK